MAPAPKWSEDEKKRLLWLVIQQLQEKGGRMSLADIEMPGRTAKAMKHTLDGIKAEVNGPVTSTPTSSGRVTKPKTPKSGKSTGRGRGRPKTRPDEDEDEGEDDDSLPETPSKTPKSKKDEDPVIKEEDMDFVA